MSDTIETADAAWVEIDVTSASDLDSEEREQFEVSDGEFCLFLLNGSAHQYVIVGDLAAFHARLTSALEDAGVLERDT